MGQKERGGITPFITTLIDTGDDTGDAFLPLSDEVIEELGWEEGDAVVLSLVDGTLVISKSNR